MDTGRSNPSRRRERLTTAGNASWSALGVILLVLVAAAVVSSLSGILIPLVVAVIFGAVLEPLISWLVRLRVPRALAAAVGLLVTVVALVGLVAIVAWGFVAQLPQISHQLGTGWGRVEVWARSLDLEAASLAQLRATLHEAAPQAGMGVLGALARTVYGLVSLGIGSFFGLFFLFFFLKDGHLFPAWLGRATGQDPQVLGQVDGHVRSSLRGYFRGTALTALLTGPIFAVPLLLLRIPLVVPILILYFFLSFIPFAGAWITGVFAILIAFGSGGPVAALIVAASLLVSNGTIQSAVSSWALGSTLRMHPVMVLLATLIGGVYAGILGMVLGAPLLAAVRTSVAALRAPTSGVHGPAPATSDSTTAGTAAPGRTESP